MAGWNGVNPFGNIGLPQMQPQMVMQNCFMPIEVRDEQEAQTYPVAANTTVMLICYAANKFWIKSTNASGTVVSFRTFGFAEEKKEEPQYITRTDFEAFKKELLESIQGGKQQ